MKTLIATTALAVLLSGLTTGAFAQVLDVAGCDRTQDIVTPAYINNPTCSMGNDSDDVAPAFAPPPVLSPEPVTEPDPEPVDESPDDREDGPGEDGPGQDGPGEDGPGEDGPPVVAPGPV